VVRDLAAEHRVDAGVIDYNWGLDCPGEKADPLSTCIEGLKNDVVDMHRRFGEWHCRHDS
jgi:hypothetical protein